MSQRIPRLSFEELDPSLAEVLRARVERLGYLGEIFQCTGNTPKAMAHFMEMTRELNDAMPANLTETTALTMAVLAGNDYERNQHERLARKLGYSLEWLAEVNSCDPGAAKKMADDEKAVQTYAIAAFKNFGKNTNAAFDALLDVTNAKIAMSVVLYVGRCVTHALAVNTLGLEPPVPSVFED
ncbi:MAG: hypothetical protein HQ503_02355 [Rhodospirillales bacterium]|nr:hypothetical protein [Rhodospirillales bacterium]